MKPLLLRWISQWLEHPKLGDWVRSSWHIVTRVMTEPGVPDLAAMDAALDVELAGVDDEDEASNLPTAMEDLDPQEQEVEDTMSTSSSEDGEPFDAEVELATQRDAELARALALGLWQRK